MRQGEIAERAKQLRLPMTELAALAGINKHTAYGAAKGRRDSLGSTLQRMSDALEAEERRLLAHLKQLHPEDSGVQ